MNHYSLSTPLGRDVRLAMQELWLGGSLFPMGARLVARHVFESAETDPLEVVYSFMLPRDAALRSFRIEGEGFSIKSALQPVKEAEEAYEEALQAGKLACQTRNYRDGVTNLMVGNLQPGQRVTVHLEILAGVESHDDGFRFSLAPSYHAGARAMANEKGDIEMELPAKTFGDVLLPPWREDPSALHRVGFDLNIGVSGGLASIESPSHPVRVGLTDGNSCQVSLAPGRDVPDRDLVLEIKIREPEPLFWAASDGTGKTSCAAWIPSTAFGEAPSQSSRVLFVLDRSGSMTGETIARAKNGILACLEQLSDEDRFNILAFDDQIESLASGLIPGGDAGRAEAESFLGGIDARGGTEIKPALIAAADTLGREPGDVILVTDGQAFGMEDLIPRLKSLGQRVHTLGIGVASQDRFLSQIARQTGGYSRFLGSAERIDEAARTIFTACKQPLATDLSVRIDGEDGQIDPPVPALVSTGMPVKVFGSAVRIESIVGTVSMNGGRKEIPVRRAEVAECPGETLRLFRGARHITDLEAQIVSCPPGAVASRQNSRLEQRLEAISRDYQLASKVMSLVAVVDVAGDQSRMLPRTHVVPTGLPRSTATAQARRHRRSSFFFDKPPVQHCLAKIENDEIEYSEHMVRFYSRMSESEIDSSRSLEPSGEFGPFERKQKDPVHWINCLRKAIKKLNGTTGNDQESLVFEILAAMIHITAKVDPERKSIMESRKFMAPLVRFLKDSPEIPGLPDPPEAMAEKLMQYPRETLEMETRTMIMAKLGQTDGAFDAAGLSSVYLEYFETEPTRAS